MCHKKIFTGGRFILFPKPKIRLLYEKKTKIHVDENKSTENISQFAKSVNGEHVYNSGKETCFLTEILQRQIVKKAVGTLGLHLEMI